MNKHVIFLTSVMQQWSHVNRGLK